MQFFKSAVLAALAALASANTIEFQSLDNVDRTVIFTPSEGKAQVDNLDVSGGGTASQDFPHGWKGNWYAVKKGAEAKPGMLGEVAFNAWSDINFFDVSAIVNPDAVDGVSKMWPKGEDKPTSGCSLFPCNNAYYLPDDIQTKSTTQSTIMCSLGKNGAEHDNKRDVEDLDPISDAPAFGHKFAFGE